MCKPGELQDVDVITRQIQAGTRDRRPCILHAKPNQTVAKNANKDKTHYMTEVRTTKVNTMHYTPNKCISKHFPQNIPQKANRWL